MRQEYTIFLCRPCWCLFLQVNYYINISLNLGYPYISTDKDLLCPVFTSDSTDINTPAESCKKNALPMVVFGYELVQRRRL